MKTFYLWSVAGSYPRFVVSEAKPEFECSPVLKEGAPTEIERQKSLPMSEWHESVQADSWREAKMAFEAQGAVR
jgi:hypothetical protein